MKNDKELTKSAALEYAESISNNKSREARGIVLSGFIAGAEWERERSKWIDPGNLMPPEYYIVLVLHGDGNVLVDRVCGGIFQLGKPLRWCYLPNISL